MAKKKSKELVKAEPSWEISPFEEMERWFEGFFRRPFSLSFPWRWSGPRFPEFEEITPCCDILEEGNDVVVKAELPGMTKKDILVTVTDDYITLSGEKKKEEKTDYHRFERSYGSFKRSFRLPAEIQADKVKAKFDNGILEVRMPKTEEAKKKEKKILIE